MKEVKLRMNEQEKYEVIKELVDHNGNKNRASKKHIIVIIEEIKNFLFMLNPQFLSTITLVFNTYTIFQFYYSKLIL